MVVLLHRPWADGPHWGGSTGTPFGHLAVVPVFQHPGMALLTPAEHKIVRGEG